MGSGQKDIRTEMAQHCRKLLHPWRGDRIVKCAVFRHLDQRFDPSTVPFDGCIMRVLNSGQPHEADPLFRGALLRPRDGSVLDRVVVHSKPIGEPLVSGRVIDAAPVALDQKAFGRADGVVIERHKVATYRAEVVVPIR